LHDAELARDYDASLTGLALASFDVRFAESVFDRPGRLIDLGCGTGRLLLPFAARGYWVLGVDLSEEMLKQVGAKAAAAGVTVHRLKANLVDLSAIADQSFDYATCLFSTLGMIVGAAERKRAVQHVHRILRPGGKFVVHVHNRWFEIWNPQGRKRLVGDLLRRIFRREPAGDRLMPVHQGIAGLTLHLFTRREICRLLRDAGFGIRAIQPLSLDPEARLRYPGFFGFARSYGYLIAAERRG
jgi:SAM-dependent methyltransferase